MTREEAIKILEIIRKRYITLDKEEVEALDVAIKDLSAEPCEDYISFPKGTLKKRGKGYVVYNYAWLKENWQTELKVMGIEPSVQPIRPKGEKSEYRGKIIKSFSESCYLDQGITQVF